MKKFLLSIAALTFVGSAFASEVVLAETDFSKLSEYPYWKSDRTTAEVKDGALVVTNAEAAKDFWDVQYMVADGFTLTGGTEYTVNVKIKDFSGTLHYNLGTWGSNVGVDKAVEESSDWQTVTIKITAKEDTDNTAHLLLQSGEFVGTYYVESVVISYEEEGGDTPDDPDTPSIDGKMVYEIDYAKTDWAFYVMGYAPEVKDGVLVSNQPDAINEQTGEVEKDENGNPKKAWYQYFIADQIPTVEGKNYVATVKIKTSTDASMALNMGWGWGEGQILNSTIKTTPEWQEISQTFENIGGEKSNLVLQPGMYDGTVEIAWVKVYEVEEGGDTPDEPGTGDETINVIASYFDGNGETFGGWGGTIEAVEEDGKPCLKYENAEAKDFWATQIAIDLDYEIGETYYFSFDVKGDGTEEITSGYQYAGKNNAGEQVYWGCGDVTPFKASPEWKSVVISGTTKAAEEGQAPGRWVANLGQYVGTLYITNVKVYTEGDSGVRVLPAIQNNRTVVYNLMGVKVLDTDDASQLNTLRKGIYIVNGKKVAL